MALKPGTKIPRPDGSDGWVGSMAEAMENAFLDEWPQVMGSAPKPTPDNQMRLMFIAVARGVVKHLHDNPQSFLVTTNGGAGVQTGTVTTVESSQTFSV